MRIRRLQAFDWRRKQLCLEHSGFSGKKADGGEERSRDTEVMVMDWAIARHRKWPFRQV